MNVLSLGIHPFFLFRIRTLLVFIFSAMEDTWTPGVQDYAVNVLARDPVSLALSYKRIHSTHSGAAWI